MDIYETIRTAFITDGITTDYTDTDIDSLILEAKLLVDAPFMEDREHEDYVEDFNGSRYYLKSYPFKMSDSFHVYLDGMDITDTVHKITKLGAMYLGKTCKGTLEVHYTVGVSTEEIIQCLIPVLIYIERGKSGKNISSINEGDVSVNYDTTSTNSVTLDMLIQRIKVKYNSRMRLI